MMSDVQKELTEAQRFIGNMRGKLVERTKYQKALEKIVRLESKKQHKSRAWHIAYHTLHGEEKETNWA